MSGNPFQKAVKAQLKARVALDGPTGSGKTWSMLEWATVLAQGGKVAVVDTEHGSASLYSDQFDFDVLTWAPPYDPGRLADTIRQAQTAGYAVLGIDSLSHFWEGEGGTLDLVDAAAEKARGNSFAGWKVGTPALRHLVDSMLACDMHVIATMRSKMEYVLETDSRGKQVPRKVGMAPVMRAGVEYEFTLVGDLDLDHRILISKSRCSVLADTMVQPGRAAEAAQQFLDWLNDGVAAEPSVMPPSPDVVARLMGRLRDHDRDRMAVLFAERGWPKVAAMSAGQVAEVIGVLDEIEASGTAQGAEPAVQDTGVLPSEAAPVGEVAGSAPATSPEPAADVPPGMSAAQSKRLHALLRAKRGVAGPARHRVLSELVGREIGSAKDLTAGEAAAAIDVLAAEPDLPPVDGPEEAA